MLTQLLIEGAQRPVQERDARRPGRPAQRVVQYEEAHHGSLLGGGQQRRMVTQAQVAAKPQYG